MIVKNEADNLPRLLKSVEGCFDEIHITDTGSTDDTVSIAEAHGAKVHHFKWVNDFSAARNASFQRCTTDFIMWMDGDDILEDADKFKLWRDNVMALADYHMAPYIYSSTPDGKPACVFSRERVVRSDKGMRWKYFVHEGIMPVSPYGQVRANSTQTWMIKHVRTGADLEKDRSRNLNLFESHLDHLDARMRYYYGKELFEAGRLDKARDELGKALLCPELELHDRILAYQYCCYAYLRLEDPFQAVNMAHTALLVAPQRAEFYTIIGDAYIKMGRIQDAVPYFCAAKNCASVQGMNQFTPIFTSEDVYGVYPKNQLARIYANLGNLEKAESEALEATEKHPGNQEGVAILDEVRRIRNSTLGFKDAVPCDDIVFTTAPQTAYTFDPAIAKSKAMGGSETALIEMAQWIRILSGKKVKVFNMRDHDGVFGDVEYISAQKLPEYMAKHKPALHIAWRHTIKVTDAPTFIWSHDLQTPGVENTANYDAVLCLTPFHKRFMQATQGVPAHKIHVTRNGIDPFKFEDVHTYAKNPHKIVFPSSPDRGLDRAMRVLDRVRETHPDVELHVFYGIEHLHKYGLKDLADRLKSMMDERPWVKYHGATQQNELIKHFKQAALWLHPCDFIETSCITAMEMVCAGVYSVTRRLGGLMDTLAEPERLGMATLLDHDCITETEYENFAQATIRALDERAWERVKMNPWELSWEMVAKEWLRDLPLIAQGKSLELSA